MQFANLTSKLQGRYAAQQSNLEAVQKDEIESHLMKKFQTGEYFRKDMEKAQAGEEEDNGVILEHKS